MDTHGVGVSQAPGQSRQSVDENIVLVGLPGAGKSSVGRRLAARLGVPFTDADAEIEAAAGMSIADIFAAHGEAAFREGEARVIGRLLREGPQVVATGGGAFMSKETRDAISANGISVWLDASTDVLLSRIVRRSHRPLFHDVDPRAKLIQLRAERDPVFAQAAIRITSSAGPHERVVNRIVKALRARGSVRKGRPGPS
ncbi:MAG: shikimate kinase [Pseudomonadota bacterium]